jgi:hypothetical protein
MANGELKRGIWTSLMNGPRSWVPPGELRASTAGKDESSWRSIMLPPVRVTATGLVGAPPSRVYGILADYRDGHPRILPRAFEGLTVEQGGRGAGTIIRFGMRSFGAVKWARAAVDEPEPGRVLVERLEDGSVETSFTVDPSGPDHARVTIATSWTPRGRGALLERLLGPLLLKRVYAEELRNLDRVAGQAVE